MVRHLVTLTVIIFCFSSAHLVNGKALNLTEDAHDIYQCPDPTTIADTPLCRQTIEEKGQIFTTLTKTVKCPETGFITIKLGCIMVTNLDENDNGGYPTILDGGIDDYHVDIQLKSQWGKGINFLIEVYTVKA